MLLTYNAPGGKEIWAAMSEAERAAEEAEYHELIRSMRAEEVFVAAEEVEHFDAARTVRVRDGIVSVSDGPAASADEFLTGYFLIEAQSLDTAVAWAARIPNARTGSVEVRPVMDIDWSGPIGLESRLTMPPSSETVVRSFFAAMNAQDADAAVALARADVAIALGPSRLVGHDALRALAVQTDDQLSFEWVARDVRDDGERVTVHAQRIQRWRTTGEVAARDEVSALFSLDASGVIARIELA
jgi:limonene-1,2-epoxide hydrolase